MVKKKIQEIVAKRAEKKENQENGVVPRITNDNVAEHREDVLSGARKYIYPLQHSKHRIVILTSSLIIVTVLVFTTISVLSLYRQQTTSGFYYQVSKVIPFPVARTGNTLIAYENYLFELRHYIHYYETQQQLSFDSEEGQAQLNSYKKRALDSVIDHTYIKAIARENDVTVSNDEIEEQIRIARDQNRLGSNDDIFEDVLRNYWDWSVNDFRRSLTNEILKQKVTRSIDSATESRATEALARLEAGEDFATLAKEYSDETTTKDNGGLFGIVDSSDRNVSQQTVDTLFKLAEGQYSGVTVIPYGTGYALEIVQNKGEKSGGREGAHIVFVLKDIAETLNDRKEQDPYRLYITLSE
jgi:hypothetical protein